eukprot:jgi/Ulvmu1/11603/UM008_0004.1
MTQQRVNDRWQVLIRWAVAVALAMALLGAGAAFLLKGYGSGIQTQDLLILAENGLNSTALFRKSARGGRDPHSRRTTSGGDEDEEARPAHSSGGGTADFDTIWASVAEGSAGKGGPLQDGAAAEDEGGVPRGDEAEGGEGPQHAQRMLRPECWTQDREAMVGAAPCLSEGLPVAGNAQVALLFLVKEAIHTEPIWAAFFAAAAELRPRLNVPATQPSAPAVFSPITPNESYVNADCWQFGWSVALNISPSPPYTGEAPPPIDNTTDWIREQCGTQATGHEVYLQQDLFTTYVHRTKGAPVATADSVFAGRDIHHRVDTQYAEPSLVAAHRALLAAALLNPRNSMFLLLSESCTPLYHPAAIWAQLAAESHLSRVSQGFFDTMRWHGNMESPHLQGPSFRKSPQWSSLTRMHALLATQDEHVWPQFEQYCRTLADCDEPGNSRLCVADEHFLATLLAAYGMAGSLDRMGRLTYTNWAGGGWHPETFYPGDAVEYIARMRSVSDAAMCPGDVQKTLRSAADLFVHEPGCKRAAAVARKAPQTGGGDKKVARAKRAGGRKAGGRGASRRLAQHDLQPKTQHEAQAEVHPFPARHAEPSQPVSPPWPNFTRHQRRNGDGVRRCGAECVSQCAVRCEEEDEQTCQGVCAQRCVHDCRSTQQLLAVDSRLQLPPGGTAADDVPVTASPGRRLRDDAGDADPEDDEVPDDQGGAEEGGGPVDEVDLQEQGDLELQASGDVEGGLEDDGNPADEAVSDYQGNPEAAESIPVLPPEASQVAQAGDERDAQDFRWASDIHKAMRGNLREQGWLGGFEPMLMHCPLFARKVSPEAVPQFADAAWRCDGLGFSWSCLVEP